MRSNSLHHYHAFSLLVRSELPLLLPEQPEPAREPDVEVRRGDVDPSGGGPGLQVDLAGVRARIFDKTTVVVHPGDRGPPMVSTVVLKRCLPALLFQRGATILHAGAVDVDGHGVAFAGTQDAGKSSLVAAMCEHGSGFLTDDILAVDNGGDRRRALPSFPRISLTPETHDALGLEGRQVASMDGTPFEPWFDVEEWFDPDPVTVDVVYLLEEQGGVESPAIRRIDGRAAMERLAGHSVRSGGLDLAEPLGRQFRQCAELCQSVPVKVLERPDGFETMPDIVGHVEADVRAV
jgi:hypothetical protein